MKKNQNEETKSQAIVVPKTDQITLEELENSLDITISQVEEKISFLSSVKNYLTERKHKIIPAVRFTRDCIAAGANMRERRNAFDWANLAFTAHQSYKTNIAASSMINVFKDERQFGSRSFIRFILGLIKSQCSTIQTLQSNEAEAAYRAEIHGLSVGWVDTADSDVLGLWVAPTVTDEEVIQVLRKIFWEKFPNGRVLVRADKINGTITCEEDVSDQNFVSFRRCDEIFDEIQKFLNHGYSRSILFHGPPGSGKSNLVKGLCYKFGNQALKFENLGDISSNLVSELALVSNPKCVILEDLDHLDEDDRNQLLSTLEDFNKKKIIVLATANEVKKLNSAVIRPERFDMAYEIKTLDEEIVRHLVGNDEEMYEMVKTWPVVFINEAMKRRQVLGDQASFEDLKERVANLDEEDYSLQKDKSIRLTPFKPRVG